MIKSLYWNTRSINTDGALERLKQMINFEKYLIIAISKPFYKKDKLEKYKKILGYQNAYSTCNSQIWLFWNNNLDCQILDTDDQQVSCIVKMDNTTAVVSLIYAKCYEHLRELLWDKLRIINNNYKLPWLVIGDFNCIIDPAEKKVVFLTRCQTVWTLSNA